MHHFSILAAFFIITISSVFTQVNPEPSLQDFINDDALRHASVGFIAKELETGKIIMSHNPDICLPTASTAKLFSTATALEILGPDYRAKTRIYTDGTLDKNGVLNGNIWIRGGGDPTLGSRFFNDEGNRKQFLADWCDSLKTLGIKKITGAIIADASEFGYMGAPDGWTWNDMGNYYGSGPSGLTLFDNMIEINFKTSSYIGEVSTIRSIHPEVPGLEIQNRVTSSSAHGDNSYIYGAPYSLDRFAIGTLPAGKSSFIVKGSLPDPELQFAYEFHTALINAGVATSGSYTSRRKMDPSLVNPEYSAMQLLYAHIGEKLIDIIELTNMKSINLFAEHMFCLIAFEKTGEGTTENGIKVLVEHWNNKINIDGLEIRDGSGLSRTNGISPNHFAELLTAMMKSRYSNEFYASLPVSGESGTLRSLNSGQLASGKIHAKSGTMNRIKSYAGYIESTSGKTIVFAIVVNNYDCGASSIKKKMEPIFNVLSRY